MARRFETVAFESICGSTRSIRLNDSRIVAMPTTNSAQPGRRASAASTMGPHSRPRTASSLPDACHWIPSSAPLRRMKNARIIPGRYWTIVIVIAWMPTPSPTDRWLLLRSV